MKKMTKKDWFNVLLGMNEVKANPKVVEFISKELELLARKNSADRKPTAAQIENEELKVLILEHLSTDEGKTVSQIQKFVEKMKETEYSNQKISALVRGLKEEQKVRRAEEKGKAYFFLN